MSLSDWAGSQFRLVGRRLGIGGVTKTEVSDTEVDGPIGPAERRAMMRSLESRPPNPFVLAEKENISSIICKSKPRSNFGRKKQPKTEGFGPSIVERVGLSAVQAS